MAPKWGGENEMNEQTQSSGLLFYASQMIIFSLALLFACGFLI
jgi:hypothetical protein